jgi:cytochrome c peroxidase
MDELTIEELKQLVVFYNKRTSDSELKNAEFQLLINRLKAQTLSLESTVENLKLKIKEISDKTDPAIVKNAKKTLTRED